MTKEVVLSLIDLPERVRLPAERDTALTEPDPLWNMMVDLMKRHLTGMLVTPTSLARRRRPLCDRASPRHQALRAARQLRHAALQRRRRPGSATTLARDTRRRSNGEEGTAPSLAPAPVAEYPAIVAVMGEEVHDMLSGKQSVRRMLTRAQSRVDSPMRAHRHY